MAMGPSDDEPTAARAEEREWLPSAAFIVVIVALVTLAIAPAVLLHRISAATREITATVIPADRSARNLALAMEERIASSRSRFLTGERVYADRLERARASETAALREIKVLAPELGHAAVRRIQTLETFMARRDSLEATIGSEDRADYFRALPRFDALRDSMLVELSGLDQSLMRATETRIASEERLARMQRSMSFVLGAVAILAALLVGWSAQRQRRLRRKVQGALREANRQRAIAEQRGEELARATETRSRLLRGVTHDVKNPLGAAKGYAELLRMGVKAPLLPEQKPFVDGIERSVDGALAIISDLLDLARVDSEGLSLRRVEAELAPVMAAAVEDHLPAARTAGHVVEVQSPPEPLRVFTDPARVTQILGNLVSNAIKYSPPPGPITVRCAAEVGDGSGTWATIRVCDRGRGIPAEHRTAIFDEFTRLDDGGSRAGHGLGLAIARRIARLLGGDLTLEDTPGGGSTFVLWLPLREDGGMGARDEDT